MFETMYAAPGNFGPMAYPRSMFTSSCSILDVSEERNQPAGIDQPRAIASPGKRQSQNHQEGRPVVVPGIYAETSSALTGSPFEAPGPLQARRSCSMRKGCFAACIQHADGPPGRQALLVDYPSPLKREPACRRKLE